MSPRAMRNDSRHRMGRFYPEPAGLCRALLARERDTPPRRDRGAAGVASVALGVYFSIGASRRMSTEASLLPSYRANTVVENGPPGIW